MGEYDSSFCERRNYPALGWALSFGEHRRRVRDRLERSPSYKSRIEGAVDQAWRRARFDAAKETSLPLSSFPENNPFTFDQIMTREHMLGGVVLGD